MPDVEVKELVIKYNRLLVAHQYELNARIRLVDYLHNQGMKYHDIYAIAEHTQKQGDEVAA